jgi:hypothetical protein
MWGALFVGRLASHTLQEAPFALHHQELGRADVTCRPSSSTRGGLSSRRIVLSCFRATPFHRDDKNGFLARARATLLVTTGVHAPGEREGRHPFVLVLECTLQRTL